MHLPSVQLTPMRGAITMYYKQKLQAHDFTIYEMICKNVHVYVWHEKNGGATNDEYIT